MVVAVVALLVLAWALQRRLIYPPASGPVPADALLRGGEEVSFDTEDGLRLEGWFVPGGAGATGPAVLVSTATPATARPGARWPLPRPGRDLRAVVRLPRLRRQPRAAPETGLAADARAARTTCCPARRPAGSIVYFGESLGAAVAIGLAAQHPPAALVLRSPVHQPHGRRTGALPVPPGPGAAQGPVRLDRPGARRAVPAAGAGGRRGHIVPARRAANSTTRRPSRSGTSRSPRRPQRLGAAGR